MSRSWAGGSTTAWRRLRLSVLARDEWTCRLRLGGCRGVADCVHHVAGRGSTGDDPRYLVAACTPCNLAIGDPSVHDPPPGGTTRW